MRTICGIAALIFGLAVASTCPAQSPKEPIEGKVVGIIDGDTVDLLDSQKVKHRIRLDGVDAPEKGAPFSRKGRQALADLVQDREVVAAVDRDRYGRTIARVTVDGREVNQAQVREGMAWRYVDYDRRGEYDQAETEARTARRGLWADERPIPPWEWRKTAKERRAAGTRP